VDGKLARGVVELEHGRRDLVLDLLPIEGGRVDLELPVLLAALVLALLARDGGGLVEHARHAVEPLAHRLERPADLLVLAVADLEQPILDAIPVADELLVLGHAEIRDNIAVRAENRRPVSGGRARQISQELRDAVAGGLVLRLALAIDDSLNIGQEDGEMIFCALASAQRKGIEADQAAELFAHAFATGHAPASQFARGALLASGPQFFDGAGDKGAASAALE
jgi:hypothetical protein